MEESFLKQCYANISSVAKAHLKHTSKMMISYQEYRFKEVRLKAAVRVSVTWLRSSLWRPLAADMWRRAGVWLPCFWWTWNGARVTRPAVFSHFRDSRVQFWVLQPQKEAESLNLWLTERRERLRTLRAGKVRAWPANNTNQANTGFTHVWHETQLLN